MSAEHRPAWVAGIEPRDPRDLEGLVLLLDLAAIYLTRDPFSTFTRQEVLDKAMELGDDVQRGDLEIVLSNMRTFRKLNDERLALR